MSYDLDRLKAAIKGNESGGNYSILGPMQKNGDQAIGAYQVMASNIPSWTREALGKELTPEEFRNDRDAQDKVFENKMGGYVNQYGVPGAFATWFSGSPNVTSTASDSLGTTVPAYVQKALATYNGTQVSPQQDTQPNQVVDNTPSAPPVTPITKEVPKTDATNTYASLLQAAIQPQQQAPQRAQIQQQIMAAPSTLNSEGVAPVSLLNLLFGNRKLA